MGSLTRRAALGAVASLPIASSAQAVAFAPPTPEELVRWHRAQLEFWLGVIHEADGRAPACAPRVCVAYAIEPYDD